MDHQRIDEIAQQLMLKRKAHLLREVGGIYYHGQRTAKIAMHLRQQILPDDTSHDDILRVAAVFHDCAKGIEPHGDHGADIARRALSNEVNETALESIVRLIQQHSERRIGDPTVSAYSKILQDADWLDHYGIYEVWMSIQYAAQTNETMEELVQHYQENFEDYVARQRSGLHFELSKRIYDEKIAFQRLYVERLCVEGLGGICYTDDVE